MKIARKPTTLLYPVPVVLVTCADESGKPNIITIAWAGTVNSTPPMVSISIRPSRYSHELISKSREFVINMPSSNHLQEVDLCGLVSGRDRDKFSETGFTPEPAQKVQAPLIRECPVNLECRVLQILPLGSHDLFLAEIVAVNVDEGLLDEKGGFDIAKIGPLAYNGTGQYWGLSNLLGSYGLSKKR